MTGAISNSLLTLISDWSNPVMAVFNLKPLSVTSDLGGCGGCGGCGGNVWVTVTGDSHCDLIRAIKSPYSVRSHRHTESQQANLGAVKPLFKSDQ